ncbi:MAG TPA: ATPase domain-containing protein, partial [Longimicrobiaceae bacterium]|nr:ATPase domain-containing protein [Longimicrobiaceae bacterium]
PGAGKTSATLQFLGYGLATGERALILTQDDPADLLAQAEYLGYDFRTAAEQDHLAVLQFKLDFGRNFTRAADPALALEELRAHIDEHKPDRIVIDSLSPFLEGGRATEDALAAFPAFLDSLKCTTYLIVPGELGDGLSSRVYDRVIAGAAGIFHLSIADGQVRTLTIHKLRQPVRSTEPLRFAVKAGVGLVEHEAPRYAEDLPESISKRLVVLHCSTALPDELIIALEEAYELVRFDSVESAFAELVRGEHGAMIIAIEPREAERAFALVREVRRAGNGAPILYVSPHLGLRGSTRARGLQAGGDDFLTDALSPKEFLERIEVARHRGHRRAQAAVDAETLFLQPMSESGAFEPLGDEQFRAVLRDKVTTHSHPFFALVVLRPSETPQAEVWRILTASLRIKEGDLVAGLPDGGLAVYLHDVRRRHVDELLRRITTAHPELGSPEEFEVYRYPADGGEVRTWIGLAEAAEASPS